MTRVLNASGVGIDARGRLSGDGVVVAVFRRSFYLRLAGGLVCVGDHEIGDGPLNVVLDAVGEADFRNALCEGDTARCAGGGSIELAAFRVTTAARLWSPPAFPEFSPQAACRGLAALRGALPASLPRDGLGCLLDDAGERGMVARAAMPAVASLRDWLSGAPDEAVVKPAVSSLLGLGPGLTPSGDDWLAGMLVALRAVGMDRHREALARAVNASMNMFTNEISAAHLLSAMAGRLRADLHDAMNAVISGDGEAVRQAIALISRRDHHSLWDGLAGFAGVVEIASAAREAAA